VVVRLRKNLEKQVRWVTGSPMEDTLKKLSFIFGTNQTCSEE
jgi:hypothetical protein